MTEEILHQDPLALASECWAKAVDADRACPAAARALFLQNEALRLRAECRRHRGWTRFTNADWPEGPLTNRRYLMMTVDREAPPAPEAVKALLDAFDQRWPNSRFAAEVALLRCGAAIDRKDWSTALDQILPYVEGKAHRELHMEAVHLADILLRLLESENRATLLDATGARPDPLRGLSRFMTSDTPGGRLLPFRDCLGLSALRVPPSPAAAGKMSLQADADSSSPPEVFG